MKDEQRLSIGFRSGETLEEFCDRMAIRFPRPHVTTSNEDKVAGARQAHEHVTFTILRRRPIHDPNSLHMFHTEMA